MADTHTEILKEKTWFYRLIQNNLYMLSSLFLTFNLFNPSTAGAAFIRVFIFLLAPHFIYVKDKM